MFEPQQTNWPELFGYSKRLTDRWYPLRPHYLQSKLWRTESRFPVVVAGRGSGKTELARRKTVLNLRTPKPWADPKYVYALPTYNQAKRIVWPDIEALIPPEWIAKNGKNKTELTFTMKNGATLFIVGMDNPARIEGIQVDGVVIDECSDQKPEAFTRSILPMLTHRNGYCWQIGVPKRTGPGAKAFKSYFEKGLRGEDGFVSYTWPSDTVLTPDQLQEILSKLDEKDAMEQLGGIFVDIGGGIYYAFDEYENVSDKAIYRPELPIGIGSDFNVDPMSWVLFHVIDNKVYVFDEIYERNTNTQQALNVLASRYGNHENGFHFIGDASAKNRHTAATSSDYIQILNDPRFYHKHTKMQQTVTYPSANPPILDRYAAVNAMCLNGKGERRLFINPKCTNLRADLTARTYKEGTREADNTDVFAGHISDALGYPIYHLFPVYIQQEQPPQVYYGQAV